jgi:hypothetical protein
LADGKLIAPKPQASHDAGALVAYALQGYRTRSTAAGALGSVIGFAIVFPQAGTNPGRPRFKRPMTDQNTPFARYPLERAIALRWTLRDIKAKRLKLSPVGAADLTALAELGLIEMRDEEPVLTQAGHNALD